MMMNSKSKSSAPNVPMIGRLFASVFVAVLLMEPSTSLGQDTSNDVDAFVRDRMNERPIPGLALAVIRNGDIEKLSVYGVADIETQEPVNPQTRFQIASTTKNVTAVGIIMLAEDGALALDDDIGKHLGDIPPHWKPVTVRQLLNHTSGLPDIAFDQFFHEHDPQTRRKERLSSWRICPWTSHPEQSGATTRQNYMLLAMLIEEHSGLSYERFIKETVFAPFNIVSPVFGNTDDRAAVYTVFDFSEPQPRVMDHIEPLTEDVTLVMHPAGGLNIPVADFATWLAALLDG